MAFLKEEKAQASIELLILIGGAIVLASIVGLLLKNAATEAANQQTVPG
ncbi:MAG: hypothetical protein WC634_04530 [archaeon]